MSIPRALVLGFLAAIVSVLALIAGEGLPEDYFLMLLGLPVVALATAGVFDSGTTGWAWRVARGLVGTVLAGLAGFMAIGLLTDNTNWFKITEPLVVLALAAFAGTCGGVAASAARPSRGFASAIGFMLGFVALLTLADTPDYGFMLGFVIVLGLGAAIGALLGTVAR
ncbi:hypothetical protein [Nannocystis radixulma]|uniref:DUF456 domain-containing protein n=1 Tax=Nannocystis radixulma TaxID=2995305 RepID=A0ABT5BFV5_9BACT|nr:hypothetical protein [Nannocystis radixulma]MDC0672972.1 hypothetical protein [Nannocystis radixulma]